MLGFSHILIFSTSYSAAPLSCIREKEKNFAPGFVAPIQPIACQSRLLGINTPLLWEVSARRSGAQSQLPLEAVRLSSHTSLAPANLLPHSLVPHLGSAHLFQFGPFTQFAHPDPLYQLVLSFIFNSAPRAPLQLLPRPCQISTQHIVVPLL